MSWLRFASDWRDGPLQRHPHLPWLACALLAGLFFLVAAYEKDWWVFRDAPESHRPMYRIDPATGQKTVLK